MRARICSTSADLAEAIRASLDVPAEFKAIEAEVIDELVAGVNRYEDADVSALAIRAEELIIERTEAGVADL